MRLKNALRSDIQFQFRQGLYLLYILVTAVYIIVLQKLPGGEVRQYLAALTIYTDPAIVGFFFIGGIVMLEKQQGVLDCLAVTPLSPAEYLFSKAISFGMLSLFATVVIVFAAVGAEGNLLLLLISVGVSSVCFTFFGFLAAGSCRTVNQYFVRAVPMMLAAILPCFSIIGFPFSWLFRALPSVAGLHLAIGAFRGIDPLNALADMLVLAAWTVLLFFAALRVYDKGVLGGQGE
ncbi:ABC transporter permease [Acetanaerobacterium elongatum]|uniref:Fluoroquinolone transport system permease protein n=1 Tax=Acetanaerobacterium elongatum TaxID=258515 RepID=A0A1G9XHG1_9FIRM|nr:ABC transporter permease [Acetanaerobacterium elongatum]SDM95685.1 fluoroquinolone transport system permease protein [Acetanaerobacterium elongatum]